MLNSVEIIGVELGVLIPMELVVDGLIPMGTGERNLLC